MFLRWNLRIQQHRIHATLLCHPLSPPLLLSRRTIIIHTALTDTLIVDLAAAMNFKGLFASISKTTKHLSLKLSTRSKRRNLYQSLLFECDALQREAEVLIEQCRVKLTQPEFNEWNTVLDVLKAERKKLIPFSGYGSRPSAELAGISTAESFKCDITTFNQDSHELARRCESRRGRYIEMSGEDIGIEGEQELQQVEDNSDFDISSLAVSEKEKLRSRSAPVKTSVAFDLKDQERRSRTDPVDMKKTHLQATRMIVHTPENALGLHFNGGPDRLQHSAAYSPNRTISLKSVLSSLLMPIRRLSGQSVIGDEYSEDQVEPIAEDTSFPLLLGQAIDE